MRRSPSATALAVVGLAATSCGGDGPVDPGPANPPVSIEAPFTDIVAVPGSLRRLSVRVANAGGEGVRDVDVRFSAAAGNGDLDNGPSAVARTNGLGIATADWLLPFGPGQSSVEARASHAGTPLAGSPLTFAGLVESFSPAVDEVLNTIEQQIAFTLTASRQSLSANPLLFARIQTKITMLEAPNLASAIVSGRRFESATVTSSDARELDVVSVFPLDSMRAGAIEAATAVSAGLPPLEAFMDRALPAAGLRIWYGFALGSSGGGGGLFLEDQGSYQARAHLISSPAPYEALLVHELTHSYIGHESMTQFLELLAYNVVETGSTDIAQWSHKRQYTGPSATNTGVHALLEIRELIGHDAMAVAYRAIYPLRPPYGQLLTAEMKQAFVDAAPADLKPQVAQKVEQIGY